MSEVGQDQRQRQPQRMRMQTYAPLLQRLRLWSGLILFVFVATHLVNHALGLISLTAMEAGRTVFLLVWRGPLGSPLLYGSLLIHAILALLSLYQRRHLRLARGERTQFVLGFLIPPLLFFHIIGTHLAHDWFDTIDSYTLVVLNYWVLAPVLGLLQSIQLIIVWLHGCMGLYFWLRLKPWYARFSPILSSFVLLLPILSLLGFSQAGREVARLAAQPGWLEQTLQLGNAPTPDQQAVLLQTGVFMLVGYLASIVLVLIARAARRKYIREYDAIRITYPNGQTHTAPRGASVLEVSRRAKISHAAVCGGRGRCSTCRVRVLQGLELLPDKSESEIRVLKRVGAPPNVRLACQLRPTHDLSVLPLLPPGTQMSESFARPDYLAGQEKDIAILFADLRGFTRISEHKLPYDVVFLLNRYFEAVGDAIEQAGGIANQFTGDGVMALFGIQTDPHTGSQNALKAAGGMIHNLAELSHTLAEELEEPLRIGVGIHTGPAVVGHMGRGVASYLTAVGDTVHVASRLQDLTKEYQCQMVISEHVAELAGLDVSPFPRHELTVRNRGEPIVIRVIKEVESLQAQASQTPGDIK